MQDTPGALLQAASGSHSGGCSLDQIAAIAMVARARATGGGFPEVIQQLPAAHMHPGCIAHRTRRLQAEQPARIGRQVAGRCSESRKRIWTRSYHPNAQVLMPGCARTAGPYQCATSASLKLHGRVFFCDVHLGSREVAGPASRTRRLGAASAAARTHTLSQRSQDIVTQAHCHIGAARRTCSIARACERAHMMGEQPSRSGGRLLAVRRGARALEPARGWC